MRKRVLLAGLYHETNTFAAGEMGLGDFSVSLGSDILSLAGDGSPLGAFLLEAERYGWEVIPTVHLRGLPGPRPTPDVLGFFFHEFEMRVSEEKLPLDAIFLILHGAMTLDGVPDAEGEFLTRIRRNPKLRSVPIFGVLDLHANFSKEMADHSTALLAYRENPHIDAAETSIRTARLMLECFSQLHSLRTLFVGTSIVWPPTGTGTGDHPMWALENLARQQEREGIAAVNVFAGFAHADTADAGVSFSIVYDPEKVGDARLVAVANLLRQTAEALKEQGLPREWEVGNAIDDALAKGLFPACLVEPADNIGGGTAGDGTTILRALLERKVPGAGVIINDPEAVKHLSESKVGDIRTISIGGRGFRLDPGPVKVTAQILRLSDGRFTLEDEQSHLASMVGSQISMGPCVVIDVEGITVLLTSERTAPMDLGQWRSQGIDPEAFTLIGVKAAIAHRRAYDPIAEASYTVRTPGPCTSDLKSLPYEHLRRPVFPLDF